MALRAPWVFHGPNSSSRGLHESLASAAQAMGVPRPHHHGPRVPDNAQRTQQPRHLLRLQFLAQICTGTGTDRSRQRQIGISHPALTILPMA